MGKAEQKILLEKIAMAEKERGDYLRNARTKAGLSQKDVSNKYGWGSAQFVSNWERGLSTPPIKIAKSLCAAYKIDYDAYIDLMARTEGVIAPARIRRDLISAS